MSFSSINIWALYKAPIIYQFNNKEYTSHISGISRTHIIIEDSITHSAVGSCIFQMNQDFYEYSNMEMEELIAYKNFLFKQNTIRLKVKKSLKENQLEVVCENKALLQDYLFYYKKNLLYLKMLIDSNSNDEKVYLIADLMGFNLSLSLKEISLLISRQYECLTMK